MAREERRKRRESRFAWKVVRPLARGGWEERTVKFALRRKIPKQRGGSGVDLVSRRKSPLGTKATFMKLQLSVIHNFV